ncbi:hypothetical protein [Modestobacter excelsi]|uniref:hypothetical protein n=1 Tax=Modestobacter excelsi TaxID=2213161 RepID=UPI00110CB948|nr:hypothetical protein [Modestobacter excelsi]
MTSSQSTAVRPLRSVPAPDSWTIAGAGVALGCALVGSFVETPWRDGGDGWAVDPSGGGGWGGLVLLVAFIAVALVLVGLATSRARDLAPERTARRALVLAVLGVLMLVAFWTGLPPVLAGGAAGLAIDSRRRLGRLPATGAVALGLAVLVVAAAVYLAFTG